MMEMIRRRRKTIKKINIGVVKKKTTNENQDEFVMLTTNLSAQTKAKTKINAVKKISSPSKGRKVGSKNWINSEVITFLGTVEILLPAGKEQWERVSMRCHNKDKNGLELVKVVKISLKN